MAIGAAIFAVVGIVKQKAAGDKAKSAADQGADSILMETEQNITQTKLRQAQTLGLAKAGYASSGVKFDATKINAVTFGEGGIGTSVTPERSRLKGLLDPGDLFSGPGGDITNTYLGGEGKQLTGETEGDSTFAYLRQMKKVFAEDVGWQKRSGVSRMQVARMGGQVAYAQSQAQVASQTASLFQNSSNWWGSSASPGGETE